MKASDTSFYGSVQVYLDSLLGLRNEREILENVARLFKQHANPEKTSVLDVCCGPGTIARYIAGTVPNIQGVGIDVNDIHLEAARKDFPETWEFYHMDAASYDLQRTFDFVTGTSAYHHIEDEFKPDFLRLVAKHLKDDGKAIVGENFLPNYNGNRPEAVSRYYDALKAYYEAGNGTQQGIEAIGEVRQLEESGVEEHKVPFGVFQSQAEEVGLIIEQDVVIWQPDEFKEDNAGSHVLLLSKTL
ncbi:class I SAM-dependent methyltransferase [Nanoarchaeota archaeon]